MIASIPSPADPSLSLGPLNLRMYGVCIALGILAAYTIATRRWAARGGRPDDMGTVAIWAVPAGLIGARLYHVITDWNRLYSNGRWWPDALMFWKPGLGIPGGILLGVLVGVLVARRLGMSVPVALDCVAPAIPVAQAIGRFGNYFNQELFGRPTTLPWGLRIDPQNRPADYATNETFHPTFAYEALWNLGTAGLIVLLDRRVNWARGKLFALYVLLYGVGRLWVESLRVDTATMVGPFRWNTWMSLIIIVGALIVLAKGGLSSPAGVDRRSPYRDPRADPAADPTADPGETGEDAEATVPGGSTRPAASDDPDSEQATDRAGRADSSDPSPPAP